MKVLNDICLNADTGKISEYVIQSCQFRLCLEIMDNIQFKIMQEVYSDNKYNLS